MAYVHLKDVTAHDFEQLLSIFYPRRVTGQR
jgi:hypothetical protein